MDIIRNQRGTVLYVIMSAFALIGLWFVVTSYQSGNLESNVKQIYSDYKVWIENIIEKVNRESAGQN